MFSFVIYVFQTGQENWAVGLNGHAHFYNNDNDGVVPGSRRQVVNYNVRGQEIPSPFVHGLKQIFGGPLFFGLWGFLWGQTVRLNQENLLKHGAQGVHSGHTGHLLPQKERKQRRGGEGGGMERTGWARR